MKKNKNLDLKNNSFRISNKKNMNKNRSRNKNRTKRTKFKKKKNNKCDDFFLLVPKGYKFINFSFGHKIKNRFICYKKSKLN